MESHDTGLESELRQALQAAAEPVRGDGVRQDAVRRTVARRRTTRRTRRAVGISLAGVAAAAVAVAFLVSSGGDHDSMRTVDRSPSTSTTSTTTTTAQDRNDRGATSSTTVRDSTTTSTSTTSTTSTAPSTSSTSSTTTGPAGSGFPPEFTGLTQGGTAWALYLAVAPPGRYDAPELQAADAAKAEAGYRNGGGFGELACDQGAPEALGRDGSSLAATVYFQTQAQAQQARTAFQAREHAVVGVVQVRTYCLD